MYDKPPQFQKNKTEALRAKMLVRRILSAEAPIKLLTSRFPDFGIFSTLRLLKRKVRSMTYYR